jgi:hypothetical protein
VSVNSEGSVMKKSSFSLAPPLRQKSQPRNNAGATRPCRVTCGGRVLSRVVGGEWLTMDTELLKALAALVPVCMLFSGSAVMLLRGKTAPLFLQLFGAGCLLVVVFTHVFEALHMFPWMGWGDEHSVGHYLDFGSALLGLALFPLGYLLHAVTK